ncbi:3-oxoacyl-[acyl-carrier-protein] reductase FabG-like [Anneissia japonica]|uniref:3-oxoacyl-[acyl-carrier-protein] reductase FabG-like n=1 Tax=Anneissia japonica TaxID=1529436 RepID=UPI00142592F5|nr:3-oxoacyl-[acyl-carrier-protein] reductase FabG-like [Anneissia japonica]
MTSLRGKVALVTGASSGIGAEVAKHFASYGCFLAIAGRNKDGLQNTAVVCHEKGVPKDKVLCITADLSVEDEVSSLLEKTVEYFGRLDVLFPGILSYCMSKSTLDHMTASAAQELATKGVRVNSVNPGVIKTEIHKRGGMTDETYNQFLEHCKETHAMGRAGTVDEVAKVVTFLASDDSSYITGETIAIDGGRHLLMTAQQKV